MTIDLKDIRNLGTKNALSPVSRQEKSNSVSQGTGSETATAKQPLSTSADSLNITNAGMRLTQLDRGLSPQAPIDAKRVEQIRQKIQSGAYTLNPSRIAEKMLAMETVNKK